MKGGCPNNPFLFLIAWQKKSLKHSHHSPPHKCRVPHDEDQHCWSGGCAGPLHGHSGKRKNGYYMLRIFPLCACVSFPLYQKLLVLWIYVSIWEIYFCRKFMFSVSNISNRKINQKFVFLRPHLDFLPLAAVHTIMVPVYEGHHALRHVYLGRKIHHVRQEHKHKLGLSCAKLSSSLFWLGKG